MTVAARSVQLPTGSPQDIVSPRHVRPDGRCRDHVGKAAAEATAGHFFDALPREAKDLRIDEIGGLIVCYEADALSELDNRTRPGPERLFSAAEKTTDENQARKRHKG